MFRHLSPVLKCCRDSDNLLSHAAAVCASQVRVSWCVVNRTAFLPVLNPLCSCNHTLGCSPNVYKGEALASARS